jgi:hypothetical protein
LKKEDPHMKKGQSVFLAFALSLLFVTAFSAGSEAGVSVGIGINIPAYRFAAPPQLVVIPGTYAYFAPDADVDVVFYRGFWYRPYEGRWYRARGYNGPWAYLATTRVPRVLIELPPDYRHVYAGYERIHYRDFHKNWKRWERDRHWDRDERWREGLRHERHEGRREDRRDRGEEHRGRGGRY